jgi:hypothetical protein
VTIDERNLRITTYSWQNPDGFVPSDASSFRRKVATGALD